MNQAKEQQHPRTGASPCTRLWNATQDSAACEMCIPAQQMHMQGTGARKRACGRSDPRNLQKRARKACAQARRQAAPPSTHPPRPHLHPGIIAETRHPGTAGAAHRHTRERACGIGTGQTPLAARATRPATSQYRVGRRRTCSDERRRTLFCERELLDAFPATGAPMGYFPPPLSLGRSRRGSGHCCCEV